MGQGTPPLLSTQQAVPKPRGLSWMRQGLAVRLFPALTMSRMGGGGA